MYKKISTLIIACSLLVGGLFFMQPKKAHAIFGMGDIVFDIPVEMKELIVDTITTTITQRLLQKMVDDTLNWAVGGFDGEPGFINNWEGFLKDTSHDLLSDTLDIAGGIAQQQTGVSTQKAKDQCKNSVQKKYNSALDEYRSNGLIFPSSQNKVWEDKLKECENIKSTNLAMVGGLMAQQNWKLSQSGDLSARSFARTIAEYGSKELNIDPVQSLIQGEGDTLKKLLGSQQAVKQFENDISNGGWAAYGTLGGSNPSTLESLVRTNLSKQIANKIEKTVQDRQTPEKFLDKTECQGGRIVDGKCKGGREIVITPRSQTSDLVKEGQKKEFDQTKLGKELSDVLAKALGRLTGALLQKGLGSISKGAASSSPAETSAARFSSTYQNEYDVLGIKNDRKKGFDTNIKSTGGSKEVDGENVTATKFTKREGADGSTPYIGGPEHLKGRAWNEGPETIVNFKESLEIAIDKTQAEIDAQEKMRFVIKSGQGSIVNLDKCLPGPDFNWEKRFQDKSMGKEGQDYYRLALSETKQMIQDPRVNIPGASEMRNIIKQGLGTSKQQLGFVDKLSQGKRDILSTLLSIRDEIRESFDKIKEKKELSALKKLPLFKKDWNALSKEQKREILIQPQFEKYILKKDTVLELNKNEMNQFIDGILEKNPKKAESAALEFAWELWRQEMEKEEKDRKKKSDLRYRYFIIQNDISSQSQVLEAENRVRQLEKAQEKAQKMLSDCDIFRSMSAGATEKQLKEIRQKQATQRVKGLNLKQSDHVYLPNAFIKSEKGDNGKYIILNTPLQKTNAEIKQFLENERVKQENGEEGYFQTRVFTSKESIRNSILHSEEESKRHLETIYDDSDMNSWITKNSVSVAEMLKRDVLFTIIPVGTPFGKSIDLPGITTGSLHCRFKSGKTSECLTGWYTASKLDYEVATSGI